MKTYAKILLPLLVSCTLCSTAQKSTSRHPAWSAQSNIYEVNLRQYSKSGSLTDFAKHLPRLKNMGVQTLWFMPINPIGVEGRKMTASDLGSYYAVKDYTAFSPEFGTMKEWKSLVKRAQGMGFKVIIDWVANHTSPDNHWIKKHPDFYMKDKDGVIIPPNPDWTDTRELDFSNAEMRDSMIAAMKFWIIKTGIDGFRCDVAGEVPDDFWKECIAEIKKVKKDVFMLAEGDKGSLIEAGFDEAYTWTAMGAMTDLYAGKISLAKFDSTIQANINSFPKDAYRLYFTSNHDENSWNGTEFEKYGDAYKTFAVFSQTFYQSVPLIYSGQEVPNKKRLKFFVKDPIEWTGFAMAPFYKTLLNLRKSNPALAALSPYKRLQTSNNDAIFAYTRQSGKNKVGVILNLSGKEQKFTISDKDINGNPLNVFLGNKEKVSTTHTFSIEPWGFILYDYNR